MCGIVGAVTSRQAQAILLAGLHRLEYRGYDSAGMAIVGENGIERRRTVGNVQELDDALMAAPLAGVTGIAHTRWATHGVPAVSNAHPHIAGGGRIALVHNGIIENYERLREELKAKGCRFESDTDSEVIAHLVDDCLQGHPNMELRDAVREAAHRLEGAFALAVISAADPSRIVAMRVGSPLVVGLGIGENFIASDVPALRPVTDRFLILEEGDLVELTAVGITVWDIHDETAVRTTLRVTTDTGDADRGNYRHYMHKEIHEQPQTVRDALEGRVGRSRVLEPAFGVNASEVLDQTRAVTIAACGTSYYTGCVARYWIEELAGIPCNVEIASEFRYRKFVVPEGSLFVTISQSGETADTLAALRIAREAGFDHSLTLCNVPMSSLVRESELALMLHAGTEVAVASTKATTAQFVALMLLTILLARRAGLTAEREAELVAALRHLPEVVEQALALEPRIRGLAEQFMDCHHALFLGRGLQYPVALEGALKLKEISYIHAEGYPAGELKHGPLALVDDDMPVVAVAPGNELVEKVRSNLEEVRSRSGRLYVFADADSGIAAGDGVTVVEVPRVHELLAPIVYTIPLQLLAYHTAVLKGTDADRPRNLAKSVTVE